MIIEIRLKVCNLKTSHPVKIIALFDMLTYTVLYMLNICTSKRKLKIVTVGQVVFQPI